MCFSVMFTARTSRLTSWFVKSRRAEDQNANAKFNWESALHLTKSINKVVRDAVGVRICNKGSLKQPWTAFVLTGD